VDSQLALLAPSQEIALLASKGLRGEIVFATPAVLTANPRLLGYYRLLLGYSQKEFYKTGTGLGQFRLMEDKGILSAGCRGAIEDLCRSLNDSATYLIREISEVALTQHFLDDLTLLTLGPQLVAQRMSFSETGPS
jgi:XcyI restriction endonuclease